MDDHHAPVATPDTVPLAGPEEIARYAVGEAVWAPSVHNTQPWSFSFGARQLSLYADPARQLAASDPAGREMLISCGAALFNARLALRTAGFAPRTQILPDPGQPLLIARLGWEHGPAATGYERRMSAQIRLRRAHRGGFDLVPLAPELLTLLQQCASKYGAILRVVADEGARAVLAEVVQAAERALELDTARARERAAWATPPGSGRTDGVPVTAYPAREAQTFPYFPSPDFAHGQGWGQPPLSTVPGRSTGLVCFLATSSDRPVDWINTGQALQRVLLTSTVCGVAAALHSQPFELGWGRGLIRSQPELVPQLLLRLGTTTQTAPGVRRPPESVLFMNGR